MAYAERCDCVCVPVFEGRFVLLRQYRHAIREFQYGFPRGFGEAGVSVEENVREEIQEETECRKLRICSIWDR